MTRAEHRAITAGKRALDLTIEVAEEVGNTELLAGLDQDNRAALADKVGQLRAACREAIEHLDQPLDMHASMVIGPLGTTIETAATDCGSTLRDSAPGQYPDAETAFDEARDLGRRFRTL